MQFGHAYQNTERLGSTQLCLLFENFGPLARGDRLQQLARTDGAYYMLERFGRTQSMFKYTRQTQLDVGTLLRVLTVLESLKGMAAVAKGTDAEATLAEAREMVRVGTLYGESATAVVNAAASTLDRLVA